MERHIIAPFFQKTPFLRKKITPPKIPPIAPSQNKNPSCRHSVAACVSDHSCGQASAPATAPSPTAKESPNPPNPSCCRSRGGMRGWPVHRPTHAPATAPSPTAKESPQSPPNPSCCRSRGGMRGWPVHRPTHAPATTPSPTAKESPQTKNPLVPSLLRRHACLTTPVVKRPLPQRLPVQPQKNPPIPP